MLRRSDWRDSAARRQFVYIDAVAFPGRGDGAAQAVASAAAGRIARDLRSGDGVQAGLGRCLKRDIFRKSRDAVSGRRKTPRIIEVDHAASGILVHPLLELYEAASPIDVAIVKPEGSAL